jgi:hypothetical protein
MIWDVNQAEPWKPGRVFDANGEEIKFVIWMDTESGEVVQLRNDGQVPLLNDYRSDVPRDRKTYPAPLTVVEMEPTA